MQSCPAGLEADTKLISALSFSWMRKTDTEKEQKMGRFTDFITYVLFLLLMVVMLTAILASRSQAASYSHSLRPSAVHISTRSSGASFHAISQMTPPASGGSNALLYAAAHLSILNHQLSGGTGREVSALSTYGVKSDLSVSFAMTVLLAVLMMPFAVLLWCIGAIGYLELRHNLSKRAHRPRLA